MCVIVFVRGDKSRVEQATNHRGRTNGLLRLSAGVASSAKGLVLTYKYAIYIYMYIHIILTIHNIYIYVFNTLKYEYVCIHDVKLSA